MDETGKLGEKALAGMFKPKTIPKAPSYPDDMLAAKFSALADTSTGVSTSDTLIKLPEKYPDKTGKNDAE